MFRMSLFLLLLKGLAYAGPIEIARAKAALALAKTESAPATVVSKESYAQARERAIQENKPFIVCVGAAAVSNVEGAVVYQIATYPGVSTGSAIVVGVPDGAGDLDRIATLPGDSTKAAIEKAIKGRAGNCDCSQDCACGCRKGRPCDCDKNSDSRRFAPIAIPAQRFFATSNCST